MAWSPHQGGGLLVSILSPGTVETLNNGRGVQTELSPVNNPSPCQWEHSAQNLYFHNAANAVLIEAMLFLTIHSLCPSVIN